ncbi:MAG: endolytic transglycosylase MltG [Candidatus Atribacteria bacterium]|nr:endolytic transglycosylase MltG [Candidatus Atribacteria bacterium]MCD6349910.1 endolytic transglycosylase MltG [Candidatus Atribacteria bacterium]
MKRRTVLELSLLWVVCVFLYLWFYADFSQRESFKEVFIPRGLSVKEISLLLKEEGIVQNPLPFRIMAGLLAPRTIRAGSYLLKPGTPPAQIVEILTRGKQLLVKVTFPEGFTSRQMAQVLEEKGICSKEEYLSLINNPALFKKEWLKDFASLEGFLFPDTYFFSVPASPYQVIETQLERFEEVFLKKYYWKSETSLSLGDLVILASLVEREAKVAEDRPLVASVFLNRLKAGMKLQSCASVIYALYEEKGVWVDHLTLEDLKIDSPFNTYLFGGLPPQPICNPGLASLLAVLYPEESDYLYFVLGKDGRHRFSRTYREHLENREKVAP